MDNLHKFPFEEDLSVLKEGEEYVIHIGGRAYIVTPATDNDIERIAKGHFCLD